jgi:hypothetical protein
MVGCRVHGADTVESSGETSSDSSFEEAIAVAIIVDTLEEVECLWVWAVGGSQVIAKILDGNVAMTNDVAALQVLWCGVVSGLSIGERASNQVGDLYLNVESLVGSNVFVVSREEDNRRDHVVVRRDLAHDDTVAGTTSDLLPVGQCLAGTEVDEVVWVTAA